MQQPQLTKQQFETLVLIYASHADYDYSKQERNFILSQSSIEIYEGMFQLFSSISDYQCLKIILNHKNEFCNSPSSQLNLYEKITALFMCDGSYTRGEKTFLAFLDKMIKTYP